MSVDDISRWAAADEGQFFERKSAWERKPSGRTPRASKDVAKDIADTLVAMANVDGGELVVGIEDDDQSLTGAQYPTNQIAFLLGVPKDCNEPLKLDQGPTKGYPGPRREGVSDATTAEV